MRYAYLSDNDEEITAIRYFDVFGRATTDRIDNFRPPTVYCDVCNEEVFPVDAKNKTPHFRHREGSNCPTKKPAGLPYLTLRPTEPDEQHARQLKLSFAAHWKWHYAEVSRHVPFLSIREFIRLVEIATEENIWAYAGLPETRIPYVLLLTADFSPLTGRKDKGIPLRKLWFRFCYGIEVAEVKQLWITPVEALRPRRLSYIAPTRRNARPKEEDRLGNSPIAIDVNFLEKPEPTVPDWVEREMLAWFSSRKDFS